MSERIPLLRLAGLAAWIGAMCHCSSSDTATSAGAGAGGYAGDSGGPGNQDASWDSPDDPSSDAAPDVGPCSVTGDGRTTVSFLNLCAKAVSFRGSDIADGHLAPGASACRDVGSSDAPIESKRYWGFVDADPGAGRHSLAEFTFNTDFEDYDWYNLSHVDAFNLPLRIVAVDRPDCRTLSCADDLLASCPAEGQYLAEGEVVACVSPDRDDPNNPVAAWFEAGCPDAYSWSGDDAQSMAACAGEDYDIVFCPEK